MRISGWSEREINYLMKAFDAAVDRSAKRMKAKIRTRIEDLNMYENDKLILEESFKVEVDTFFLRSILDAAIKDGENKGAYL